MFNATVSNTVPVAVGAAQARRAHLLVYDIPKGTIQNPSAMLWRYGARINLSCWVIPDSRIALLPLDEWESKGVQVELVRFDERDGETIIRLAREALTREVARWHRTLEEGTLVVRAACSAVTVGEEGRKQAFKAGALASGHLRRARQFIGHAHECALAFDLTGDMRQAFEGLHQLAKAKEELFYTMVKDAKAASEPKPLPQIEMPDVAVPIAAHQAPEEWEMDDEASN